MSGGSVSLVSSSGSARSGGLVIVSFIEDSGSP